jgi:hypothetical protein
MGKITEAEFGRICSGIDRDRDAIIKHNPIGTEEEILLWMLMSCLVSYLSLNELETPCFHGTADARTYRQAIDEILQLRRAGDFDTEEYIAMIKTR